jgi:hypothetical protein
MTGTSRAGWISRAWRPPAAPRSDSRNARKDYERWVKVVMDSNIRIE